MNKIISFLKSIILPRSMVKYINLNFFISFLIFIVAAFLNVSTANSNADKQAKQQIGYINYYDEISDDIKIDNFPNVSVEVASNKKVTIINQASNEEKEVEISGHLFNADENGVYHKSLEVNERTLDITIVTAADKIAKYGTLTEPSYPEHFDLEGYLRQKKEASTDYMLFVFTMDQAFYLYNLELNDDGKNYKENYYKTILELADNSSDYKYYLPMNEDELVKNSYGDLDTTKWTRVVSKDDEIDFTIQKEENKDYLNSIKPVTRHNKNIINALFGSQFSYSDLYEYGFDVSSINTSLKKFIVEVRSAMLKTDEAQIKVLNLVYSLLLSLIFPLIFTLISWLLSKSFVMKKFKNYYAVCAICFIDISLLAVILGIFFNYSQIAMPILIAQTIFYIIASFRINTSSKDNDGPSSKESEERKKPIEYQNVASDVSKIG